MHFIDQITAWYMTDDVARGIIVFRVLSWNWTSRTSVFNTYWVGTDYHRITCQERMEEHMAKGANKMNWPKVYVSYLKVNFVFAHLFSILVGVRSHFRLRCFPLIQGISSSTNGNIDFVRFGKHACNVIVKQILWYQSLLTHVFFKLISSNNKYGGYLMWKVLLFSFISLHCHWTALVITGTYIFRNLMWFWKYSKITDTQCTIVFEYIPTLPHRSV